MSRPHSTRTSPGQLTHCDHGIDYRQFSSLNHHQLSTTACTLKKRDHFFLILTEDNENQLSPTVTNSLHLGSRQSQIPSWLQLGSYTTTHSKYYPVARRLPRPKPLAPPPMLMSSPATWSSPLGSRRCTSLPHNSHKLRSSLAMPPLPSSSSCSTMTTSL